MVYYKSFSFIVRPLYATPSDKVFHIGDKRITLRDFQAKVYEELLNIGKPRAIFLEAPTGAGKTYTLLIPMLTNKYEGIVGIYPTKTLAKDQYDSIYNVLTTCGTETSIEEILGISDEKLREIEESLEKKNLPKLRDFLSIWKIEAIGETAEEKRVPGQRCLLILITSETVEALKLILGKQSKIETFTELVNKLFLKVDYRIIFTVPEYPYMFHEMSYGEFEREGEKLWKLIKYYAQFLYNVNTDAIEKTVDAFIKELREVLDHYRRELGVTRDALRTIANIYAEFFRYPLFIDEFHLYTDIAEISLLVLLYLYASDIRSIKKIIFSSATPRKGLLELAETILKIFNISKRKITASCRGSGEEEHLIRGRTKVTFHCVKTAHGGVIGLLESQSCVPEIASDIIVKEPYKKTMVILDRVGLVLDTCEAIDKALKKEDRGKLRKVYITSIKIPTEYCEAPRLESLKKGDYDILIGNLAIAQGVDLKYVERGIVYAKDMESFIQRFGRVPRGKDGEVHIIVDWEKLRLREELEAKELDYDEFIEYLRKRRVFPKPRYLSWLNTYIGFFKLTFPIFAQSLWLSVLYRDAEPTLYSKLRENIPKLIEFIKEYFNIVRPSTSIEIFLRGTLSFLAERLYGNYITIYRLMAFRDIPSIDMKIRSNKGIFEGKYSLTVVARNFRISRCKETTLEVNFEQRVRAIPILVISSKWVSKETIKRILNELQELNNSVFSFSFLGRLLLEKEFTLEQVDRRGSRVGSVLLDPLIQEHVELFSTPTFLRIKRKDDEEKFDEYALFLAYTREAIPLAIRKGGSLKIIGVAIFL